MRATVKGLACVLAIIVPVTTAAQNKDSAYCKALIDRYEAYVINMRDRIKDRGTVDGRLAVEQCKAGNTAAGIPVLERKLRDARVDLPRRG
ncbi:MAG: hypothetical protein ACHQK9_23410 [Reyranellales bacterium]